MHSAEEAEAIIHEEVERMMARLKTREVVPTIVSLQEQLEKLRDRPNWLVCADKFGSLTPEQEAGPRCTHQEHDQQDRARADFGAASPSYRSPTGTMSSCRSKGLPVRRLAC